MRIKPRFANPRKLGGMVKGFDTHAFTSNAAITGGKTAAQRRFWHPVDGLVILS